MRLSIINKYFSFSSVKRFSSLKRSLCLTGCFLSAVISASAAEGEMKNDSIVHDTLVVDANGQLSRYDRRVLKYREHWDLLIPTNGALQICGNMGVFSLGLGWDYGKHRQWETFVMLGYIPRFDSDDSKLTLTPMHRHISTEPRSKAGAMTSTTTPRHRTTGFIVTAQWTMRECRLTAQAR